MDKVIKQIREIAGRYKINKVLLFGSRARGDNNNTSDYDIAVIGETLTVVDRAKFSNDIEEVETLKKIDVVFVNEHNTDALSENIMREGIVIYDEARSKN